MIATADKAREERYRALSIANGGDPRIDEAEAEVRGYVQEYKHWKDVCRLDHIAFRDAKCKMGSVLCHWRKEMRANQGFGHLLNRVGLGRTTAWHSMKVAERLCDDRGRLSWEKCLAYGLNKAECLLRTTIGDVADLNFTQCAILCGARKAREKRSAEMATQRDEVGERGPVRVSGPEWGESEERVGVVDRGQQRGKAGESGTERVDGEDGAQLMLLWDDRLAARTVRVVDRISQAVRLELIDAAEAGSLVDRLVGIERDGLALIRRAM